jgi:spermidine/putrescine transport system permease protein
VRKRIGPLVTYGYLLVFLVFLYAPVLVMMLMSFNRSPLYDLPIVFDLRWFRALAHNARIIQATVNSVILALANTVTATVIGIPASLALARYEFRAKNLLSVLLVPPVAIPWLILAVSMLLFFQILGLGRSLPSMYVAHVAVSLPYAILVMTARLSGSDPSLEEAAMSLGANPLITFLRITFPLMLPGVIAAALFSFTVSFDNFVISYFLAPPGVSTLPVEIYSAIRKGFTPEINAIATVTFGFSMILVLIANRLVRFD